jgi:hypothetical protein
MAFTKHAWSTLLILLYIHHNPSVESNTKNPFTLKAWPTPKTESDTKRLNQLIKKTVSCPAHVKTFTGNDHYMTNDNAAWVLFCFVLNPNCALRHSSVEINGKIVTMNSHPVFMC